VELDIWLEWLKWLEWYRRILSFVPARACRNVGFLVCVTAGVRAQARGGTNRGMEIKIVPRIWLQRAAGNPGKRLDQNITLVCRSPSRG